MAGRRVADFRFPTPKQERHEATRRLMTETQAGPPQTDEDLWWASVLADPRAAANARQPRIGDPLSAVSRETIRVECLKCFKVIEFNVDEARRFYGGATTVKQAGTKLLERVCTSRTGNRDSDGCWPEFRRNSPTP